MAQSRLTMALVSKANDKQMKLKDVAAAVGVSSELAMDWLRGTKEPEQAEVKAICDYLGCSLKDIERLSGEKPATHTEAKPTVAEDNKTSNNTRKEEKMQTETKTSDNTIVVEHKDTTPAKEQKPRTSSVKKNASKKSLVGAPCEEFVRKTLKLKKSDPVDERAVLNAYCATEKQLKELWESLSCLFAATLQTATDNTNTTAVEPRLEKLMDAAANASDEGIEVAITILKKFKK